MGYNTCFSAGADKGVAYDLYNRCGVEHLRFRGGGPPSMVSFISNCGYSDIASTVVQYLV